MGNGFDCEDLAGPLTSGARPGEFAEDTGQAAEAGAEYGVLAGGEQLAGGDPAGHQLESADSQNRYQDKGSDDRGLGAGAGQDAPGEEAVLVQFGEQTEDPAFFAGVGPGRGDRAEAGECLGQQARDPA